MSIVSLEQGASSLSLDEQDGHLETPTAATNIDLAKFPDEIRLHVYEWTVGKRTIHVRSKQVTEGPKTYIQIFHHTCRCPYSETEIYNACSKSIASPDSDTQGKLAIYPHKLCSHCPENCTHRDNGFPALEPLKAVDLSLLATSSEANDEAKKLFYSTNTFSFQWERDLRSWLLTVPADMKPWVRSLHLKTSVFAGELTQTIAQLPAELPNLRTVHISIIWFGFVTCRRLNHDEKEIAKIFRPLRQLQKLKTFTVVMKDVLAPSFTGCTTWEHDAGTHDYEKETPGSELDQDHLFWDHGDSSHCGEYRSKEDNTNNVEVRRELCRVWAEEIREVVLSAEVRGSRRVGRKR